VLARSLIVAEGLGEPVEPRRSGREARLAPIGSLPRRRPAVRYPGASARIARAIPGYDNVPLRHFLSAGHPCRGPHTVSKRFLPTGPLLRVASHHAGRGPERPKLAPLRPRSPDECCPPAKSRSIPRKATHLTTAPRLERYFLIPMPHNCPLRFFTTRIDPVSLIDRASFARQSLVAIGGTARNRNQDHDRYGSAEGSATAMRSARPSAPIKVPLASP
jgi:hypothetical protein